MSGSKAEIWALFFQNHWIKNFYGMYTNIAAFTILRNEFLSRVFNGIGHKKYYLVLYLHRFTECTFSSENIFPSLVFYLTLQLLIDTMSDNLDTFLGKHAKSTEYNEPTNAPLCNKTLI
jgi:hypothetical protein